LIVIENEGVRVLISHKTW